MGMKLSEYHRIVEDSAGCQISSLTTEEGEITLTDSSRIRSATWSTRIFARR
jgi:hypothetical protein